ncbi:MAG: Hpt domain-containing protein [Candidatus Adiutrix sp.]|nr:Hpt domain-containing protein [Candidatus Adiutrix sp.]
MSDDLLNEFIFDARDHLGTAGAQLLDLEKKPDSLESLNALMGTLHTIKGNSGFLDLANLYKLLHHAESLLQTVREKQCTCPQKMIDLLLQVLDTVEALLSRLEKGENDQVEWLETLNQALSESETSLEGTAPLEVCPAPVKTPTRPSGQTPAAQAIEAAAKVGGPDGSGGQIDLIHLEDRQLAEDELFPSRVEAMFSAGLQGLVVDLRDLGRLTNPELKVLMAAGQKKPESTAFLLNFKNQAALYRIFQLLRLDHFMHFCADQAAAVAYLKKKAQ